MSKVSQAHDKGQHPDDHDGTGDGVRSGDKPSYSCDDPTAHDTAPEDSGGGIVDGFESEVGESLHDLRLESVAEGHDRGEGECSEDVGWKNGGPETKGLPEVLFLSKD